MVCLTEEETQIFGWEFDCDVSDMAQYSVKFSSDYPQELIKLYVQRGEYRSDYPFDLCQNLETSDLDGFFLLIKNKPNVLTISNNPLVSIEKINSSAANSWKPSGLLFVTTAFEALQKNGYIRVMEERSLIGRSKGHACLLNSPRLIERTKVMDLEIPFGICYAESFEIVERAALGDIILYDPRHEIFDTRLGISSKGLIPTDIIEHEVMERTPEAVQFFERGLPWIGE